MHGTEEQFGALSPDELLKECNKVREAGGGEILSSLLPGTPNDSHACLIATNLNFGAEIDLYWMFYDEVAKQWTESDPEGVEKLWCMSASNQHLKIIHETLGWKIGYAHRRVGLEEPKSSPESGNPALLLPEKLACSAEAFDEHAYDSSLYY